MHRGLIVAFLLAVGPVNAGCDRGPRPSDITKIALVENLCDPNCRSLSITLYDGPAATVSFENAEDNVAVRSLPGIFAVAADALTSQTDFFTGRTDYREHSGEDSAWLTAWTGNTRRQVVIPTSASLTSDDRSLHALQRLAALLAGQFYALDYKVRAQTRHRLADLRALQIVEYRANGCYGTCPAYTVRFRRDGNATISMAESPGRTANEARARVPFDTILQILQASAFTELRPRYPFRTTDVFGAHLLLSYRDGFSFQCDAPDSTTWPREFQELSDRIDQLVLDTNWKPPLPPRRSRVALRKGLRVGFDNRAAR